MFFMSLSGAYVCALSLHDALPILSSVHCDPLAPPQCRSWSTEGTAAMPGPLWRACPRVAENQRSEEHTSELQSHSDLVCRLLLEKKKLPSLVVGIPLAVRIIRHVR